MDGDTGSDVVRRVFDFWFGDADSSGRYAHQARWFRADPVFDATCVAAFGDDCERAAAGAFDSLEATAEGSLALVLLLDQLPRNIHRSRPEAFAGDERARAVARTALKRGFDMVLPQGQRLFLYLPFEHSEDLEDQDLALALMATLDDEEQLRWAQRHRDVIARFGRFPHRNAIIGRPSTPEEEAFLRQPASSF